MQKALFQWGAAALLALLTTTPLQAADNSGVRPVAEELGQRAAAAATTTPETQQKSGLSDSAVRVLLTYAFSLVPNEQKGADGKTVKVDKSDPNKFLIPDDDARRIIRAATRSAFAHACELEDLARANYKTLMQTETAKKIWSEQQLLMINALHMFSASYFAGGVKISGAATGSAAPKDDAPDAGAGQGTPLIAPKRPDCPPEQKQKVINSINAYIQSAKAPAPAPSPAVPASSGSN